MNIIRYGFWAIVAVCLITIGLANRQVVSLQLFPQPIGAEVGMNPGISMPLFMAIFIGVALGLLIGLVWEWIREAKERAQSRARAREIETLKAEVARLKAEKNEGQDDVLALLDEAG